MDTLRRSLIDGSYQILVDLFCHERDHRRSSFADLYQCCIKRHIGIDLILLHSLRPETLTASSDIPVAHVIYKLLQRSCSLRDLVVRQVLVYFCDHCVQLGQKPFVHDG